MSYRSFRLAALAVLAAGGLPIVGCGVDRQDAIDELEAAGYEPESAQCIMTELESQGFGAGDLEDPLEPEVEGAIEVAVERCLTAADLVGLSGEIGEDQLRLDVVDELVAGGMEQAQAECIVDRVVDAGFTMIDLARAGLESQTEGGVVQAVSDAAGACAGP